MKIKTAMIMAAGLGTRMKPLSDITPKPFLPLLGKSQFLINLQLLKKYGIQTFLTNIHHLPNVARSEIEKIKGDEFEIVVSDESSNLLGSGGGVRTAFDKTTAEIMVVINGDNVQLPDIRQLVDRHYELFPDGQGITLLLKRQAQNQRYRQIEVDHSNNRVIGLGEKKEGGTFFSGVSVIHKSTVEHLAANKAFDFVEDILKRSISRKCVGFDLQDFMWMDLGTPELWAQAHFDLSKNEKFLESAQINKKSGWETDSFFYGFNLHQPSVSRCIVYDDSGSHNRSIESDHVYYYGIDYSLRLST